MRIPTLRSGHEVGGRVPAVGMPQASVSDTAADSLPQTLCRLSEILMLKGSGTGKRSLWEMMILGQTMVVKALRKAITQVLCSKNSLPEYQNAGSLLPSSLEDEGEHLDIH